MFWLRDALSVLKSLKLSVCPHGADLNGSPLEEDVGGVPAAEAEDDKEQKEDAGVKEEDAQDKEEELNNKHKPFSVKRPRSSSRCKCI